MNDGAMLEAKTAGVIRIKAESNGLDVEDTER